VIAASRRILKVESEITDDIFYKVTEDGTYDCMDFQNRGGMQTHVGLNQERDSLMTKAETLDLEILTQNETRTERIFLSKNQFEVLNVVAQALDQTISEYITDTLLSMMECDIDETVTRKPKERFGREPVEVYQR
jgi:hypothetical protein